MKTRCSADLLGERFSFSSDAREGGGNSGGLDTRPNERRGVPFPEPGAALTLVMILSLIG